MNLRRIERQHRRVVKFLSRQPHRDLDSKLARHWLYIGIPDDVVKHQVRWEIGRMIIRARAADMDLKQLEYKLRRNASAMRLWGAESVAPVDKWLRDTQDLMQLSGRCPHET